MMANAAWYGSSRWKTRRAEQLRRETYCRFLWTMGQQVLATVADHKQPHRGNEQLFWRGELWSLCKVHHDCAKQRAERRGYDSAVGLDGWPLDSRHPANTGSLRG